MPVHKILLNEIEDGTGRKFMEVFLASDVSLRLFYDTLPNPKGQKQQVIQSTFQDFFDVRIARVDLPDDEPDKAADPNTKRAFWDGVDVVYRTKRVTKVVWENAIEGVEELEIERVKD